MGERQAGWSAAHDHDDVDPVRGLEVGEVAEHDTLSAANAEIGFAPLPVAFLSIRTGDCNMTGRRSFRPAHAHGSLRSATMGRWSELMSGPANRSATAICGETAMR